MFLTEANVLHYLLEKRFTAPQDAVSGQFSVRSLSRRNRNFHVTSGAREYLVKQVKKWDSEGRASLEREAAVYLQARTNPGFAPVAALAPQSYAWDPADSVLILEYLPGHTEMHDLPDRFAPGFARMAGQAMREFHRGMRTKEHSSLFPAEIPWQLSMHETKEEDLADESAGRRELLRAIKKYSDFGHALDHLRAEWRAETVIQGDWKLDNCLISADRGRLRVVDWEFACWGDPLWDLGTLLQSYWSFWVRWPSRYRIEEVQPALRAVLEAYPEPETAGKAIRFAGARMLQTAFEQLDKADQMTAEAARLLQASLNILTRPEWAAGQLLGMA